MKEKNTKEYSIARDELLVALGLADVMPNHTFITYNQLGNELIIRIIN